MAFLQARNYTRANRTGVDLLVFHTGETPETPTTAEGIANYFHTTNVEASAHWAFDDNSEMQCVLDKDIAWHAPPVNDRSIGFEHAGYARQSVAEWQDPYSEAMLRRSAKKAAEYLKKYNIPLQYVDVNGLKSSRRGITTHNDISQAFHKSDHWDPGPHFPMNHYLALVNYYRGSGGPVMPSPPISSDVFRRGDSGNGVKFIQAMLNILAPFRKARVGGGIGAQIDDDGVFGGETEEAVREFQRWVNDIRYIQKMKPIAVDGVVGRVTTQAIAFWVPVAIKEANTIRPGDKGSNVKFIQGLLNFLLPVRGKGAKKIDDDGVFGSDTAQAVREFKLFANSMFHIAKNPKRFDGSPNITPDVLGAISFWSKAMK